MRMPRFRVLALALACLASGSCGLTGATLFEVEPAVEQVLWTLGQPCRPPEFPVVVEFPGPLCGFWLVATDEHHWVLEGGSEADPLYASSSIPPLCQQSTCSVYGARLGDEPVILAVANSLWSEMAEGAALGLLGPEHTLVWIDLWEGGGTIVDEDNTPLGPSHALEPMACGESVGFIAKSRLIGAAQVEPAEALLQRQGLYQSVLGTVAPMEMNPKICYPINLPFP